MSDFVQIELNERVVYRYTLDRAGVINLLASHNVEDRAHLEALGDGELIDALNDAYCESEGVWSEVRGLVYASDSDVIDSDVIIEAT